MTDLPHNAVFYRRVINPLDALGRRLKGCALLQGLCHCGVIVVLLALAGFTLDRLFVLGVGPRIVVLAITVCIVARQVSRRLIQPARVRIDINDVAAVVEYQNPQLRDMLVSAVSFATRARGRTDAIAGSGQDSDDMVAALLERSTASMETVRTDGIVDRRRHGRYLLAGLACLLVSGGLAVASPEVLSTYLARGLLLRDVPWPSRIRIVPDGFSEGRLRWPIGDELTLKVTAPDEVPSVLRVELRSADGESVVRDMDRLGENQFVLDHGPLAQSLRVRFLVPRVGTDEPTGWYNIEAVPRPAIANVDIIVKPPAYSGLAEYGLPGGQTQADVFDGSTVRITATTNKPVVRASLRSKADGRRIVEGIASPGTGLVAEFVPIQSGTYYFDLTDDGGMRDLNPVTYTFRLIPDPPPKVRLSLPGAGQMVVPNAVLELVVDCEDNLGLRRVDRVYCISRGAGDDAALLPTVGVRELPDLEDHQMRYSLAQSWPLSPMSLVPSDRLTVHIRATDYQSVRESVEAGEGGGAGAIVSGGRNPVGESAAFTLRVVTPEELLAELGRREQEWRREFEQIVRMQEQLNKRIMDLRDDFRDAAPGQNPGDAAGRDRSIEYGREQRTQQQQVGRLTTVRRQFEQILAELRVNQLASPEMRRRLDGGIIRPLNRLMLTDVPSVVAMMGELGDKYDDDVAVRLEETQQRILQQMRDILSRMFKWEGYNEAVGLLRDIVQLQGALNTRTETRLEEAFDELFGDDSPDSEEDRP